MRSRLLFAVVASLVSLTHVVHGQEDRFAGGLRAGDYVRLSGGITTPVNPQGSVRDWDGGTAVSVAWENWQPGGTGVGRLGLALAVSYSLLPLNEGKFITDFSPLEGGKATTATAGKAGLFQLGSVLRFRIPAPLLMPTINLGIGFINWRPADVHYTGTAGSGTTKQRHRSGAELSIGGSLERHIVDRFGVFADAVYAYGFTSLGRSSATPGGFCATSGCDVLKNTSATSIRGGLSVRVRGSR
jgi:hypothetical protein